MTYMCLNFEIDAYFCSCLYISLLSFCAPPLLPLFSSLLFSFLHSPLSISSLRPVHFFQLSTLLISLLPSTPFYHAFVLCLSSAFPSFFQITCGCPVIGGIPEDVAYTNVSPYKCLADTGRSASFVVSFLKNYT